MDARLRLLYFIALASSLYFARTTLRLVIIIVAFAVLLILFRRASLRRPRTLLALLFIAGSIFVLHCFFAPDGTGFGQFSAVGCQEGTRLALIIVSLWSAATLLFSSARPRELTRAIGAFLPFASRRGSFAHTFVSLVSNGLLVFPFCKSALSTARTAARARGGSFRVRLAGQSRRNLEKILIFALRRLYLRSDEIFGQLACRGYAGPEVWLKRGNTIRIGASQALAFVVVTGLTVAILVA